MSSRSRLTINEKQQPPTTPLASSTTRGVRIRWGGALGGALGGGLSGGGSQGGECSRRGGGSRGLTLVLVVGEAQA